MSFLGTDATSWLIRHIQAVKCRADAVELGQVRHLHVSVTPAILTL